MKMLQVPTCVAVIMAPYWILYTKSSLKENFNNGVLAGRAFGYYFLANCIKVFVMASGVPEILGTFLLGEKFVMSLLDCSVYAGLIISLRGKANAHTNSGNIVVGTALGWSMPGNIGRIIFESIRCIKQLDHSDRFIYTALQANLYVLSSIIFAAIFFMLLREKRRRHVYTGLVAIAMFLFPILSMFNEMQDEEVNKRNFIFLACQGVMACIYALVVRWEFRKLKNVQNSS